MKGSGNLEVQAAVSQGHQIISFRVIVEQRRIWVGDVCLVALVGVITVWLFDFRGLVVVLFFIIGGGLRKLVRICVQH